MRVEGRVLNLVLTHQPARAVEKMVAWWGKKGGVSAEDLLVAYGGQRADFEQIAHPAKIFVEDRRLQTKDHQREAQSYSGVFRAAAAWLARAESVGDGFSHVYLAEYDHLPLVSDLNDRQRAALEKEGADVLGLRLRQVEESSHAHFLYHADDPEFLHFWEKMSLRRDREARAAVLTMFGTGSFWTREAFTAVAEVVEPFPIYLELFLPTAAHHLGFRVRPYPEAEAKAFIEHLGDLADQLQEACEAGAWTIHPVKKLWAAG